MVIESRSSLANCPSWSWGNSFNEVPSLAFARLSAALDEVCEAGIVGKGDHAEEVIIPEHGDQWVNDLVLHNLFAADALPHPGRI